MKFDEKRLGELKQLDRIEFRQKLYELKREEPASGLIDFFYKFMMIIGFIILLGMMFIVTGHNAEGLRLLNLIPLIVYIWFAATIVLLFVELFILYLYNLKYRDLFREYFKGEAKRR